MAKVFLGGTCNESKWRDKLIPMLKIDYFNPVVDDWNEDAYQEELKQRKECDYCLYISVVLFAASLMVSSCGIYSFTGTSIQPDVKTVTINYFEYKALKVNPSLSNDLTEALRDKFIKLTKLEQVDIDGDLELIGAITGYDVRATAINAQEQAAQNRLTVTVKLSFVNRKHPEDDFDDKSFSAYADFDAMQSLEAVQSSLCEEIIEKLCEDMFNASVANW